MQPAALALACLAFAATGIQARQPASPARPETQAIPITPYKPAQSPTAKVQSCPTKFENHPEVDGVYRIRDAATPPKPVYQPEAEISDQARKAIRNQNLQDFHTVSVLSFVVDPEGRPQDICIKREADLGLDGQAIKALRQYRFDPATKDGTPVAVRITIEVSFSSHFR
jgi:TonB family protein